MNDPEIPFLTELRDEFYSAAIVQARPAARRRSWRWSKPSLLVSGGGITGIAVIAVAVVLAMTATNATPPAFAVTENHDGTVTLSIRQVSDLVAVNKKLAQFGVRARIVPLKAGCSTSLNNTWYYEQPSTQPWSLDNTSTGPIGSWTVGIIPGRIPVGHTLVFTLAEWHHDGWQMADEIFKGAGPQCATPYGSGFTYLSR